MVSSIYFPYFTNIVQLLCSLCGWLHLNCSTIAHFQFTLQCSQNLQVNANCSFLIHFFTVFWEPGLDLDSFVCEHWSIIWKWPIGTGFNGAETNCGIGDGLGILLMNSNCFAIHFKQHIKFTSVQIWIKSM